jgi:hypothetical protein
MYCLDPRAARPAHPRTQDSRQRGHQAGRLGVKDDLAHRTVSRSIRSDWPVLTVTVSSITYLKVQHSLLEPSSLPVHRQVSGMVRTPVSGSRMGTTFDASYLMVSVSVDLWLAWKRTDKQGH